MVALGCPGYGQVHNRRLKGMEEDPPVILACARGIKSARAVSAWIRAAKEQ